MTPERLQEIALDIGKVLHCGRFNYLREDEQVQVILQVFDGIAPWEIRLQPLGLELNARTPAFAIPPGEKIFINDISTMPPEEPPYSITDT